MSALEWATRATNIIAQWIGLFLRAAEPEDVPDSIEAEAESGTWHFTVTVKFEKVEPISEQDMQALFGLDK